MDNMLHENPIHGYLVGRLQYLPCAVMQKRSLTANVARYLAHALTES